jgi:hypothetical protein
VGVGGVKQVDAVVVEPGFLDKLEMTTSELGVSM